MAVKCLIYAKRKRFFNEHSLNINKKLTKITKKKIINKTKVCTRGGPWDKKTLFTNKKLFGG